ncbi:PTS IIA-like nitrogen regulatory protein PtsN [Conservatibacter flavescens]|uniref:PTS IIA-like nitrogen-regulatory protein PtsN n=1 Tax=Conservatibacter flavescens TaxID=28161 RepID=A0A2M8S329_9PAST|nr:PTS IIA-like nitrogen regulatory protein PtsN [Conservatibacter flavescens]PJG85553.1 PTS IIA-like nitrogen-regulatory protein PtsN [Conservatibacter flavescens]
MKITDLLPTQNIRQGILCSSKKRVLEVIANIAAEHQNLEPHLCFEQLCAREKLGCTSLGGGVALPHAKLAGGEKPVAVFLQLDTAIDFSAADRRDVDLFFALLIPEHYCDAFKIHLARLAECLTDKSLCKQLRNAQSAEEIWEIFEHIEI